MQPNCQQLNEDLIIVDDPVQSEDVLRQHYVSACVQNKMVIRGYFNACRNLNDQRTLNFYRRNLAVSKQNEHDAFNALSELMIVNQKNVAT